MSPSPKTAPVPLPTPPAASAAVAALCKAAGDVLRLEILAVLRDNAFGVLELAHLFASGQSGMSHHLKVLATAGLVTTRRDGNAIFYRRAPIAQGDDLDELRRALFHAADQLPLAPEVVARRLDIHGERAQRSREFFRNHAARFRENQDLIAGYRDYGRAVLELLDGALSQRPVRTLPSIALEVGAGAGELLADLAPRFSQVVALDNAPEMLAQARAFAADRRLANVVCIAGDTAAAVAQGLRADVITLNMVLHHTPAPAAVIAELAAMLRAGGSLIITELCHHNQDWARTACGDLWLGFEAEELTAWARAAGLSAGERLYLAQRNGFRVQIHQFCTPIPAATPPSPPSLSNQVHLGASP